MKVYASFFYKAFSLCEPSKAEVLLKSIICKRQLEDIRNLQHVVL